MSGKRAAFLIVLLSVAGQCAAQQSELFEAARAGDLAKLRTLAGNRAWIDLRGPHNRTALHEAAANCQLPATEILLRGGWDTQARDDQGRLPAMLTSGCPDNIKNALLVILRPPVREEDPWSLQYATAHHQTSVVSMLLVMGVDANALGSNGNRALDISCLNGDAAGARLLLEHGANPNLPNKVGSTPLHDAALSGNHSEGTKDLIEVLLKHGANINAVDSDTTSTPLHYAASFDRLEAVKTLVRHGADISLKNSMGFTAFQLAARNDFADICEFLSGTRAGR